MSKRTSKCTVTYTQGQPSREYASIQDAAKSILTQYPEGVIYDAGNQSRGPLAVDSSYDVRGTHAGRAWASEADSVDDDGAKAVASIDVVPVRAILDSGSEDGRAIREFLSESEAFEWLAENADEYGILTETSWVGCKVVII